MQIFTLFNGKKIYFYLDDEQLTLTSEPTSLQYIRNDDDTISIVKDEMYLSAIADCGEFAMMPQNIMWERFTLEPIDESDASSEEPPDESSAPTEWFQLLKIKLVIWDLDDTLWQGTLAEGDTPILYEKRAELIKQLNLRGIVNSICSKNNFDEAKKMLLRLDMWDQFVFPKISYSPKGEVIKNILDEMHLQAKHTLFIDDNDSNLNEAKHYNPELNVLNAKFCEAIPINDWGKYDENLTRLKQYRSLEIKTASRNKSSSNEEFLRRCHIRVEFLDYSEELFARLYELVERTNQLNFTKNRMTVEQLRAMINDPEIRTQLIRAEDDFGDYGIIGFYSIRRTELIHFVFSCRIMNMCIEQFVYEYLNYPALTIVGETASRVGKYATTIDFIQIINNDTKVSDEDSIEKVLSEDATVNIFGLGACDLYHVMGYFSMPGQNLFYECNVFLGDRQGVNTGTEYIRSMLEMDENEKAFCRAHFYNYARFNAFDSKIFDPKWDYVILSFSEDMRFKIYEYKANKNLRAVAKLTYVKNIKGITRPNEQQELEWIYENFNVGYISPQRFADNLALIASEVPLRTKIVLITGPEIGAQFDYRQEMIDQIATLNKVIRLIGRQMPDKFAVVEINDVVKSKTDVTNSPFHLKAVTAYNLFAKIIGTMIEKFPNSKPPMLQNVLKGRRLCLLGRGDQEMMNALYNLRLCNNPPDEFVCITQPEKQPSEFRMKEWSEYIGKSDEYFFVVADNTNYAMVRELLMNGNYKPLKDFVRWKPLLPNKEWQRSPQIKIKTFVADPKYAMTLPAEFQTKIGGSDLWSF